MSDRYTRKETREIITTASVMLDDKHKDDEERGRITYGISIDRLRELAEAEREGKIRIGSVWTPCAEGMPKPEPYNTDHIRDATKKVEHIVDANKKMEVSADDRK